MGLNLVLVTQRQTSNGLALAWSPMEDVASYEVFVATRRLSPEELEGAQALGGTEDCLVAKVGGSAKSVVDDVTPVGEARYYAVAMLFKDGTVRAARFRAVPDGATADSVPLSSVQGGAAPEVAAPARPAARPAAAALPAAAARPVTSSGFRAPAPAPAPEPPADEDPLEARKRAQREARERAGGAHQAAAPAAAPRPVTSSGYRVPTPAAPAPAADEDPLEARKRAQREARERAAGASSEKALAAAAERAPSSAERPTAERSAPAASAEPPPPPASVPLEEGTLDLAMKGSTQTWDGLRLYWERAQGVAAYEVIASDHQIFNEEVADAFAGRADFTIVSAVAPAVTCVIDNVTAREARGWYSVVVRGRDGKRAAHPFQIGDAATSGKKVAPFLNPTRTGEVRAEADDLVAQAREQWARWKSEQDGGARREARRMIDDALLIFPNYPAAKALSDEMAAG